MAITKPGLHQGFAIGNGLTNPEIQYGAYADYALDMKLISQSDHDSLSRNYATCQQSIKECSKNNLFTSFLKNDCKKFVYLLLNTFAFYAVLGADGGEGDACASSYVVCNNIFQNIMDIAGNVNVSIKSGIE